MTINLYIYIYKHAPRISKKSGKGTSNRSQKSGRFDGPSRRKICQNPCIFNVSIFEILGWRIYIYMYHKNQRSVGKYTWIPWILLLMEEILHQLIGSLSHYWIIWGGAGFFPSTVWVLDLPLVSSCGLSVTAAATGLPKGGGILGHGAGTADWMIPTGSPRF